MSDRPNIVLILNDDMGYSDIGCYGGEVRTPNLDRLAAGGVRLTQFYNTARCCPSRASLLTGLHPHQTGVGHMMSDDGIDGYRGDLNFRCVTIADVLRSAGYSTYMSGKWHVSRFIDGPTHSWPCQRGFDRFYGIIEGASSYFDPVTLTRDNERIETPRAGRVGVPDSTSGAPMRRAARGEFRHRPGRLPDIMATCIDVAGAEYPAEHGGNSILPLEGHSLMPIIADGSENAREARNGTNIPAEPDDRALYWEHEGNRSIRRGKWKLVCRYPGEWELYDIVADRTELHDLAADCPEVVEELSTLHDAWQERCTVTPWSDLREHRKRRREESKGRARRAG
jgi:arylsulfatase A-like enzyme